MDIQHSKIVAAAREHGTPAYIYDGEELVSNYHKLKNALPNCVDVFYALKVNPNISLVKLLRSKGYFCLATRPEFAGQWSQAGGIARYGFSGMFWKAVPKESWPTEPEYLESIESQWVEPFGDMRQELVFIGQNLNQAASSQALDDCLLTEEEVLRGRNYWETLADPFPAWQE